VSSASPSPAESAGDLTRDIVAGILRDVLLTAAARRPLVLLLEDLHWADAASLDLLRFLARGLTDAALG